jgi:hypothetical protein
MKKNIKLGIILATVCYILSATFVYADPLIDSGSTVSDLIYSVMGIFDSLIPLLIGAAVVVFLYGVLLFIAKASAGNAEGRKEGINFMIFGIIGIAVMVSVWGLVAFVTNTFGTTGGVPQFNDQAF